MAVGESAGSVFVTIDGDASPLLARYAQAESASRAAGQRISTALGGGLVQGSQQLAIFNALLAQSQTEEGKAANASRQLAAALQSQLAPAAAETAVTIRAVGEASRSSVTDIQATSAALRTLEGGTQGSLRAAERFLSVIPGVGAALQVAFPLVGAIALAEIIGRIAGKFDSLSESEKKATEEAAQLAKEIHNVNEETAKINIEVFKALNGPVAGAGFDVANISAQIQLKERALEVTNRQIEADQKALAAKKQADEELALQGQYVSSNSVEQEALNNALQVQNKQESDLANLRAQIPRASIDLKKQNTGADKEAATEAKQAAEEARRAFKDGYDNQLADLQAAHQVSRAEELKFRQQELADAQARGPGFAPVATEVNRQVGTLSRDVDRGVSSTVREGQRVQVEQAKKTMEAVNEQLKRTISEGMPELEAVMSDFFRLVDEDRTRAQRSQQESLRTSGERTQVSDEAGKARLQVEYASQLVHSRSQELAYAESIAQADSQAILDKIASLEVLKQYQSSQMLSDEANKTDLEIEKEKVALLKQQAESESKIAELKQKQSLAGQIQSKAGGSGSLLDDANTQIADTYASAVNGISAAFGRAVQGGQSLSKIFQQLGRTLLGDVVSSIAKVGLQMVTTALIGKAAGSAIAVAEVTSAAAVGAANAAASTAAIPIVGPALAPGVAAATFAEIMAWAPLASYDKGGFINQDQIAMVHKGEYVLTADQVRGGFAMPSVPSSGSFGVGSAQLTSSMIHNSASQAMSIGAIHLHGVRDMQDVARRLPDVLKARSPVFSPASR